MWKEIPQMWKKIPQMWNEISQMWNELLKAFPPPFFGLMPVEVLSDPATVSNQAFN